MTANKILKSLTPERIKKELAEIQAVELPADLQKWVKEYEKVGDRDPFIWKWAFFVSNNIKLQFIQDKYDPKTSRIKFLMIILITLIDDIADKKQNMQLLEKIFNFSFDGKSSQECAFQNAKDKVYSIVTHDIWNEIKKLLNELPNFKNLSSIIEFDFKQIWNSMIYACIINNNPSFGNKEESRIYLSNSTPAIVSYMIDLCCFNGKIDIGAIRSIGLYCQLMVRISNTLATYKRERKEGDFSGEVPIYRKKLKNQNDIEQELIRQWDNYYKTLSNLLNSFDKQIKKSVLSSIEKILIIHLSSRGKI